MADCYQHPPSHPQSVIDGCICPPLDNAHGKGCGYLSDDGDPVFIVNADCPLHGTAEFFPDDMRFGRDLSQPPYGAASRLAEKIA